MNYIFSKNNSMNALAELIIQQKDKDVKITHEDYLSNYPWNLENVKYIYVIGYRLNEKNVSQINNLNPDVHIIWIDPYYTIKGATKAKVNFDNCSIIVVGTNESNPFKHIIQSIEDLTNTTIISTYEGSHSVPFTKAYRDLEIGSAAESGTILSSDINDFIKFLQSDGYDVVSKSVSNNRKKTLVISGFGNKLIPDGMFDKSMIIHTEMGTKIKLSSEFPHYLSSRANSKDFDAVASLYMPTRGVATMKYLIVNKESKDDFINYFEKSGFKNRVDNSDTGYMTANLSWETLLTLIQN